jgi:serine/threonine protein kinase
MTARFQAGSTVGDYRIVDFLGAGGMGEVYRVIHPRLGVAALKVLTQCGQNEDFNRRFMNEAHILSGLHHPNIVAFHDFVEHSGFPCIIMEYVDGVTLADYIRTSGGLPADRALAILKQVLAAVAYIHARGIIHRDIKSNNVRITSGGQVKLLDFGIARTESTPRMTVTGAVIGSWQALSPEQIRGERADARSDIWALGVLLYEMLTGRAPFDSPTLFLLAEKIQKGSYRAISDFDGAGSVGLERIVARCLKRNPEDRFQTVEALAAALPDENPAPAAGVAAPREWPLDMYLRHALLLMKRWPVALGGALLLLILGVLFFSPDDPDVLKHKPGRRDTSAVTEAGELQPIMIEVTNGQAEVFKSGSRVGKTPYHLDAAVGERVDLVLKQDGCDDRQVSFTVTAATRGFTLSMRRK